MLTGSDYKQAEFEYAVAEAKRGFKIHAVVYGVVMTALIILNGLLIGFTDADFPGVIFPLVGWVSDSPATTSVVIARRSARFAPARSRSSASQRPPARPHRWRTS
jgi:2TM domain